MIKSFFVSDLHGKLDRYEALSKVVMNELPDVLFLGGDLLPGGNLIKNDGHFISDYLYSLFGDLKARLQEKYPKIFLIMGNDDPRSEEKYFIEGDKKGLWNYIHKKICTWGKYTICGYAHVPPTPFLLKDWERYDVSRFVDVGSVDPLAGFRTVETSRDKIEYYTIAKDIEILTKDLNIQTTIFLFHTPPYQTKLDRAALDGKMIDYAPLDVHVGSIAVKRFIEEKQPYLTLHGHIHESSEITGSWQDEINKTHMFSAAWNKEGLALVRFDLDDLSSAERIILT